MLEIITATGRVIESDLVVRGNQFAVLHIYTHSITPVEAYQIFGDPKETTILTVIDKDDESKEPKVYRGFTEVYSVQKGIMISGPDEILIWLQRPDPDTNTEVTTDVT